MLLDVHPIEFDNKSLIDNEGRMAWSVGNNSARFIVIRYPDLQDEQATWRCDCPRGNQLGQHKIDPTVCDHTQEAYLYWLNAENRKRNMMEEVKRHSEEQKRTENAKPIEPVGYIVKPKRIINLE